MRDITDIWLNDLPTLYFLIGVHALTGCVRNLPMMVRSVEFTCWPNCVVGI